MNEAIKALEQLAIIYQSRGKTFRASCLRAAAFELSRHYQL